MILVSKDIEIESPYTIKPYNKMVCLPKFNSWNPETIASVEMRFVVLPNLDFRFH